MNGSEFIIVASKVVAMGVAGTRSATSRAYYGAFHAALEFLADAGCPLAEGPTAHNLAHNCLGVAASQNAKVASQLLGDLHTRRIHADYRLNRAETEVLKYGQASVEMAERMTQYLATFKAECDSNPLLKSSWLLAAKTAINLKR